MNSKENKMNSKENKMNTMTELEQIESYFKVEFSKMTNDQLKKYITAIEPNKVSLSGLDKSRLQHHIFMCMRCEKDGIETLNKADASIIFNSVAPEPQKFVAPDPQKIDHSFGESVERSKIKITVKENKMNSNTNSKKTKKTCTCSTCGKTGHNASNKKFHPDYEFTGVSVPTEPNQKVICEQCEAFIESEFWENWAERTTKWVHKSKMTICINDGSDDRADEAGNVINMCFDCVGATDQICSWVEKKDWLKKFGTEDLTAAVAAAKAMCYVDQRDSPNVLPYKKCWECNGRSSCGSYVEKGIWTHWICEDCMPEEEPNPYMEELIECIKCENEVKRKDMAWTAAGGAYLDVCGFCSHMRFARSRINSDEYDSFIRDLKQKRNDDDSKDLIIIKGAKPEPIPIVVISENRKCLTPCKTRPMMGRSWWKCLGYDSPCSCAYEAQAKCK